MRTRIKICGLTEADNARRVAALGADTIGLVFYPPSPRAVSIEQARLICQALPPFVTVTALFVDETPERVSQILQQVPVDLLQFHGDESPSYCQQFSKPYIKAVRVRPAVDLPELARQYASSQGLLLDAYKPGVPGGTGESFDWQLITPDLPLPVILAGGLDPNNVADAVNRVSPYAVDVSGGVEASKGIKDIELVERFIEEVARADRS
ncbi:phosphoribosylanthranilate isomerase [Motiliproteus sp.]|uniref:phosphoribosylanthranilate isomerase n=1 Tax=Motiliproteus sp. TaxID=1898955 RepID=UPI003BAD591C